jgi:hypothetical protein
MICSVQDQKAMLKFRATGNPDPELIASESPQQIVTATVCTRGNNYCQAHGRVITHGVLFVTVRRNKSKASF